MPFSTQPQRQPIVISHGNLSSLHFFEHQGEEYEFRVAAHIDREALLDRQEATVMVRPELRNRARDVLLTQAQTVGRVEVTEKPEMV